MEPHASLKYNYCGKFGIVLHHTYVGILISVSLGLLAIGWLYFYDCPLIDFIPIYVLVLGAYGIVEQVLYPLHKHINKPKELGVEKYKLPTLRNFFRGFMICWFVWGSVQIFELYEPNYTPAAGLYCNKTLFLVSFWFNLCVWGVIAFFALFCITTGLINYLIKEEALDKEQFTEI